VGESMQAASSDSVLTGKRCDPCVLSNRPPPVERRDSGCAHDSRHKAQDAELPTLSWIFLAK
jgi:hypothetical protein